MSGDRRSGSRLRLAVLTAADESRPLLAESATHAIEVEASLHSNGCHERWVV